MHSGEIISLIELGAFKTRIDPDPLAEPSAMWFKPLSLPKPTDKFLNGWVPKRTSLTCSDTEVHVSACKAAAEK